MRRLSIAALVLGLMRFWGASCALGQSMDDLNLQVHGYATQGFVYSTNNNWNTTDSTDGSAAWTEAVVNLSAQPEPKLRIGVQARYYLLGDYGNAITLDWAQADYKMNDRVGFRVGKVKSPSGMLNETQDIDPAQLWVLLPQGVYPLESRNSTLAHFGGVVYGAVGLGESMGKLEYRGFAGQRVVAGDDGYLQTFVDAGFTVPNGLSGPVYGGTLRWQTPIEGLMAGFTVTVDHLKGAITLPGYPGTIDVAHLQERYYFARYEHKKVMLAGEFNSFSPQATIGFAGLPATVYLSEQRLFYVMASYKISGKLTGGAYYSSGIDKGYPTGTARYHKDWTMSARYDMNSYMYVKAEEHVVDGTMRGFSTSDNTAGLQPNTRMSMLKLGVSF